MNLRSSEGETFLYAWGNNPVRERFKGRECRIVVRGSRMYSVLAEFDDGERIVTSMRALRAQKKSPPAEAEGL